MKRDGELWPVEWAKISRPARAPGLVSRTGCLEALDANPLAPLTLVSAPAGFGKSTVVVEWLETRPEASAWVELDPTDGEPQRLLRYVAEAIRSVFPECMDQVLALACSAIPPSVDTAATFLSNDLAAIPGRFILVLDDFHRVRNPFATALVDRLTRRPPEGFRLVLVARWDPPLPLASLRAKSKLIELRADRLTFGEAETTLFLSTISKPPLSPVEVRLLHETTEGWPVALQLARGILERRSTASRRAFIAEFSGTVDDVREYLLTELLSPEEPPVRALLDVSSVLDVFNGPLLEWLLEGSPHQGAVPDFMAWIARSGLPVVRLDRGRGWLRYHHLILDLLRWRARERSTPEELGTYHRRAAEWFEAHEMVGRSLDHLLAAGAEEAVIALFIRQRNQIMGGERWAELNSALGRLPEGLVDRSPVLLLLQAFSEEHLLRLERIWPLVDRAEALLDALPEPHALEDTLRGEIDCLRSVGVAEEGRLTEALELAERALERLPRDALSQRGHAISDLASYLQMLGRPDEGRARIRRFAVSEGGAGGTLDSRIRFADAYLEWMDGDMPRLEAAARAGLEIGERSGLPETRAGFRHFLGLARYQLNDLSGAEAILEEVVTDRALAASTAAYMEGGFALASTRLGLGDLHGAREVADRIYASAVLTGSTEFQAHAEAFLARLDLCGDDPAGAFRWAASADLDLLPAIYRFYFPGTTQALVGIAEGSPGTLERTEKIVRRIQELAATYHNRVRGVEAACLMALLADRRDDHDLTLAHFRRAIECARPGHVVRVFADLIPPLISVLDHVYAGAEADPFVREVLEAARRAHDIRSHLTRASSGRRSASEGAGTLSVRQREVLGLLHARLTNKEIAQRLFISPGTVKRHTEDIYQKLGVHDRRSAVERASTLGLLGDLEG